MPLSWNEIRSRAVTFAQEVNDATRENAEVIRALTQAGWSRNKIAEKIGGRRSDALDTIRWAVEG